MPRFLNPPVVTIFEHHWQADEAAAALQAAGFEAQQIVLLGPTDRDRFAEAETTETTTLDEALDDEVVQYLRGQAEEGLGIILVRTGEGRERALAVVQGFSPIYAAVGGVVAYECTDFPRKCGTSHNRRRYGQHEVSGKRCPECLHSTIRQTLVATP